MKKLILLLLIVSTLVGCSYRNIYVMYDNRGCAFSVIRNTARDTRDDTWDTSGGSAYQATLQRLSTEDKATCPLSKEAK
jgi:hypothetical protein